jgi:hypothetical protein
MKSAKAADFHTAEERAGHPPFVIPGADPLQFFGLQGIVGPMQSPAAFLAAALVGRECRVTRREADWSFDFGERLNIASSVPWRIVTAEGIAHGDEDDGQWFGLAQPIDGEGRSNELLRGQKVVAVALDEQTADLEIAFDGGVRLDLFNNSAGYEGWQASVPVGREEFTVIALGGGRLTIH